MPIYFQEGVGFRDREGAESLVRQAFAGTFLESIYDGEDDTKEVYIWDDWHTSTDPNLHLGVRVFQDNDGVWVTSYYHVYGNGIYRYLGDETPSTLAQRNEKYNTQNWYGES